MSLGHAQNAEFIDNTNSAGLSSMQRAIDAENIPRMEGLIKNGVGYYWGEDTDALNRRPLINYAISNNKPKAVNFLLSKQTVADFSTVLTAMEKTNYVLVKKLFDQNLLGTLKTSNIIIEHSEVMGRYSNVVELEPYDEIYATNWQFTYTLTNAKAESFTYTMKVGTNLPSDPRNYILRNMFNDNTVYRGFRTKHPHQCQSRSFSVYHGGL